MSSMALDYLCEGTPIEESLKETLRFSFVKGDPSRSDRFLEVSDQRIQIAQIDQVKNEDGIAMAGLLNSTKFRNFSIFVKNAMEFDTTMIFNSGSPQFKVHCSLLIP